MTWTRSPSLLGSGISDVCALDIRMPGHVDGSEPNSWTGLEEKRETFGGGGYKRADGFSRSFFDQDGHICLVVLPLYFPLSRDLWVQNS